jgi:hypothetical protein
VYQAYLLLKADNDFSFATAHKRLAERFPAAAFTEGPDSLAMATGGWDIALHLTVGPDVLAESQRIAEQVTGGQDDQGIGACDRRIEIASDVPDPEMDHFDKYLLVLEAMQGFRGVIAVDPKEPCVL